MTIPFRPVARSASGSASGQKADTARGWRGARGTRGTRGTRGGGVML